MGVWKRGSLNTREGRVAVGDRSREIQWMYENRERKKQPRESQKGERFSEGRTESMGKASKRENEPKPLIRIKRLPEKGGKEEPRGNQSL